MRTEETQINRGQLPGGQQQQGSSRAAEAGQGRAARPQKTLHSFCRRRRTEAQAAAEHLYTGEPLHGVVYVSMMAGWLDGWMAGWLDGRMREACHCARRRTIAMR
jgi:hypothetical protein